MFFQPKDILLSRVLICSYLHRAVVLLLVVMGSYYSTVSQCLSPEDLQRIETGLRAGSTSVVNEKLRKELNEMKKGVIDSMQTKTRQNDYSNRMTHGVFEEDSRVQTLEKTIAKKYDKTAVHFCEFLKKNGWFSNSQVGGEGAAAGFYLLKNFIPYEVQLDLIPAISIAISRNELNKNEDFASFLRIEHDEDGKIAEDADGAGFLNSRIVFTPKADAVYRLVVTTCDAGDFGAYRLTVRATDAKAAEPKKTEK